MFQSISLQIWIVDTVALIFVVLITPLMVRIWLGRRKAIINSPSWRAAFLVGHSPKRWAGYVMAQFAFYLAFTFSALAVPAYAISGLVFACFAILALVSFIMAGTIICFWWPKILIPRKLRHDKSLVPLMRARIQRQLKR